MSVPQGPTSQTPAAEHAVSVDLAAFLPEGVELADAADDGPRVATETETPPPPAGPSPERRWHPDVGALDAAEADLDAVDAALIALDERTYGICRACAQPIADDLLATTPTRTTCAAHA